MIPSVSVHQTSPQVTVSRSPFQVSVSNQPAAQVSISQPASAVSVRQEAIGVSLSSPTITLTCAPTSFHSSLITLTTSPLLEVRPAPLPELSIMLPEQGPPGPQGLQGPAGGQSYYTAATALSGHRAVALNMEGEAVYADHTTPSTLALVGLSSQAVIEGESFSVVSAGLLNYPPADLTPDQAVFLSTEGFITQTLPQTHWLRVIGVAVAPGLLSVDIGSAYWLGES